MRGKSVMDFYESEDFKVCKSEEPYYTIERRKEVRDTARKLRKQFLKYQEAEIVYSMSHRKIMQLAQQAGAIYRMDSTVLINRDIFDAYLEQFREKAPHRYDDRDTLDVSDEYDVQDLLHSLLKIYCDDIRPEEWTPSYAGTASRQDFLLKDEKIVIETKKTRKGLNNKELANELIIDIARYTAHPDCKKLICFVYDPENRIKNPRGFEKDLSKTTDELTVVVYIRP